MEHKVFEHKLKGGAKGLVVHVPGSQVVNLVVRFNSGMQFGEVEHFQLPHIMEHMVGGTTTHYPKHTALKAELVKNGAHRNAHTGTISNWYDFEFAQFELDRMVGLQKEYFTENLFSPGMMKVEISNIRQELNRRLTQYPVVVSTAFLQASYPQWYVADDVALQQLDDSGRAEIVEYYERTHTRGNLRFYFAGDFPDGGKQVVGQLDKALSDLPTGDRFEADYSRWKSFGPVVLPREIEQIYYQIVIEAVELPEELQPASSVLSALMGTGYASRIYGEARRRGLAYDIAVGTGSDPGSARLWLRGYVTLDKAEALFRLAADQIVEVRDGKLTDEEVEAAKNLRIGGRIRGYQTVAQLSTWYMGEYEEWNKIEDWDGWNDKLRAVTREQVIEVARHVTTGANFGSAFVGPITESDAQRFAKILENIGQEA